MIYLWRAFKNSQNKYIAIYDGEKSPDRYLFNCGKEVALESLNSNIIFQHKLTKRQVIQFDNIPNNSDSPLVNQKIVNALLELSPTDVQFFDAEIRCKDGVLTNYKLLNVISTIMGLDHEKSIYNKVHGTEAILGFEYCAYKPNCMGGHQIARNREYQSHLLVTQKIKHAFEKEKFTGIWFVTPEEWYGLLYRR